jgi:hypothetical protein
MDYSMLVGLEERDDVNQFIERPIASNSSVFNVLSTTINERFKRTATLDKKQLKASLNNNFSALNISESVSRKKTRYAWMASKH